MRLAAILLGSFVCAVAIDPALAQTIDGDPMDREPYDDYSGDSCLGPDDPFCDSGGGGSWTEASCWSCLPDSGFSLGCPGDTHCYETWDNSSGEGLRCQQSQTIFGEDCHTCRTWGGACYNVDVNG